MDGVTVGVDDRLREDGTVRAPINRGRAQNGRTIAFQNSRPSQLVVDFDARQLSQSIWASRGPEPQPIIQPAFAPAVPLIIEGGFATVELALTLFTWLSARNSFDQQAVISFTAREYRPGATRGVATLGYVGMLTREEVEAACPRLAQVQSLTNDAAAATDRRLYLNAATYGTAVHTRLRAAVEDLHEADLKAEVSFLKSAAEAPSDEPQVCRYGKRGTVRIDVLEHTANDTVCVYDIKTGIAGLMAERSQEIASTVYAAYGSTSRIIVTEVRPKR